MVADLKGVGQNYQDHAAVCEDVFFHNTEVDVIDHAKTETLATALQFLLGGKGQFGFLIFVYLFNINNANHKAAECFLCAFEPGTNFQLVFDGLENSLSAVPTLFGPECTFSLR